MRKLAVTLSVLALLTATSTALRSGPPSALAQAESEQILDEIRAMLGGLGGADAPDPRTWVAAELPRVEALSGMKAKRPVPVRLVTREEAVAHVASVLAAQLPPPVMRRTEVLYRALGFLPPGESLESAITSLFGGQAGGFYDPERGELVLLKDLPSMLQLPVLRHELVHALQDQNHDLSALIAAAKDDEDRSAALQAVLEGHAVDVMQRATLASMAGSGTAELSPGLMAELRETLGVDSDAAASEMLDASGGPGSLDIYAGLLPPALPVLQTQLLFPYTTGATFVAGYRAAHPEDPGCTDLYERLPRTSAEILDPRRRKPGTKAPDLQKPGTLAPDLKIVHHTTLGRLLTWILMENQPDPSAGDPRGGSWGTPEHDINAVVGSGWRGDHVALFEASNSRPGTFAPGSYAVVWAARWRNEAEARAVAARIRERRKHATIVVSGDRTHAVFAGPATRVPEFLEALRAWR